MSFRKLGWLLLFCVAMNPARAVLKHSASDQKNKPAQEQELSSEDKEVLTHSVNLETKHGTLAVEFHAKRYQMGYIAKAAEILRRDAPKIIDYFQFVPGDTVHILLNDSALLANGSATVFPRNLISLNVVPPLTEDALAENSNWSRGLLLHELTHILHLDLTRGILKGIRSVFGSVGKMGGVTPRWFTEGVAVWAESYFTTSGRLDSALIDYELEKLILDESFCASVDCLDQPGNYPYGRHPYWIGSRFLNSLEKKQAGTIRCLVQANSDSLPFFLNSAFKECVGQPATTAFIEFRENWKKKIESKLSQFRNGGLLKGLTALKETYGTPLWQANSLVIGNKLWRAEVNRKNKTRLVSYLNDKREDFYFEGYLEKLHFQTPYSSSKDEVILSFLKGHRQDRIWKIWNTKSNQISKEVSLKNNAAYLYQIKEDQFLFLRFYRERWELWQKTSEKEERIFQFPLGMDIYSPRVFSSHQKNYLGFQSFVNRKDGRELYSYHTLKIDETMTKSKLWVLYQGNQPLEYLEMCGDQHLLREDSRFIVLEQNNKRRQVSRSSSKLSSELIQIRWNETKAHLVLRSDPKTSYFSDKNCSYFIEAIKKKGSTEKRKRAHRLLRDQVFKIPEEKLESYPSLSHFVPTYWLVNFQAGDAANSFGASTVLSDPRGHHAFGLGANYFFDLSEVGPNLSYSYTGDWARYTLSYNKFFTNNSFRDQPDSAESTGVSVGNSFRLGDWFLSPSLYATRSNISDFISSRQSTTFGGRLTLDKRGEGGNEALFQSFSLLSDLFKRDVEGRANFLGLQGKAVLNLRWMDRLFSHAMLTFGKFDKDDFSSGLLFGGGNSGLFGVSFHEFYGLNFSDAFGNEILTARWQFEVPIWEVYRGSGLSPLYFKRLHLLGGTDFIKADRIFIDQSFLFNESIYSLYGGVELDLTAAYLAPIQLDIIFARAFNDFGNDEDSIFFVLKGQFF